LFVYDNRFILVHASVQKITEITKPLKICYLFNITRIHFKTICQGTKMVHQQQLSRCGSCIIERTVGVLRQRSLLAFMLMEDILSTCCNKNDVTCMTL